MPREGYYLPERSLVSQQDSALIERANVPRSKFHNTWSIKTAFDAGFLYPIVVDEVIPGDHMIYDLTAFVRMGTLIFPLLDTQRLETFFFFTPNRLVWTNWVRFMGEQPTPAAGIAFSIPQIVSPVAGFGVGTVYDYAFLPTVGQIGAGDAISVSALPFRMINLIWTTWFRDQNMQDSATLNTGDGPDNSSDYGIFARAKTPDYFTTALPWPQKFTAPTVPLGGLAPIQGLGFEPAAAASAGPQNIVETGGASTPYAFFRDTTTLPLLAAADAATDAEPLIYANLAAATGVAINTFRQAFLIQQLLERDARGGTRYTELIKSHFGVTNPDFRLQRPEYIGGGSTPINITPIAQTTPIDDTPLGNLGGAGTAAGNHRASYAATEHGYIIAFINVKSEISYSQGIPRHYSRLTRYDFYWPSLAQLGEQAIYRKEIYATGASANDDVVFGYQERWHEYRTQPNYVTGLMRPTAANGIANWHLSQQFTAAPTLNSAFIKDTPPMARILAAGSSPNQQYLADILVKRTAIRPLPTFGTPALLGRF